MMAGWVPRWLAVAGNLLHSFGLVQGASKASLVLKLNIEWQRLLQKFVDTINYRKNRLLIDC
jgi:hypothetical protein